MTPLESMKQARLGQEVRRGTRSPSRFPWRGPGVLKGSFYNLDTGERVLFSVNPAELVRTEEVLWGEIKSPGCAGLEYQYAGGGPRQITFTLILDKISQASTARGILKELSQLELFTYPRGSDGLLDSGTLGPPRIALVFGGRMWEVVIKSLKITEQRFDLQLVPLFAEIKVVLLVNLMFKNINEAALIQRREHARGD